MNNKTEYTWSLPESHQALHLRAEPREIYRGQCYSNGKNRRKTITRFRTLKVRFKRKKIAVKLYIQILKFYIYRTTFFYFIKCFI